MDSQRSTLPDTVSLVARRLALAGGLLALTLAVQACGGCGDEPGPPGDEKVANLPQEPTPDPAEPVRADPQPAPKEAEPQRAGAPKNEAMPPLPPFEWPVDGPTTEYLAKHPAEGRDPWAATARERLERAAMLARREKVRAEHLSGTPTFKQLRDEVIDLAHAYSASDPATVAPIRGVVLTCLELMVHEEPYLRRGGVRLMAAVIRGLVKKAPSVEHHAWIGAVAERWRVLRRVDDEAHGDFGLERGAIFEIMTSSPTTQVNRLLMRALDDEPNDELRVSAAKALARCARRVCPVPASRLTKWLGAEDNERVRRHLWPIAAQLPLPDLLERCSKKLGQGLDGIGCLEAISELHTPEAFEVLYTWVEAERRSPASFGSSEGDFEKKVQALDPYAHDEYAAERYVRLLDAAVGQTERSGFITALMVRRLGKLAFSKDEATRAAGKIAVQKHFDAYSERYPEPEGPQQVFLMKELQRALDTFKRTEGA